MKALVTGGNGFLGSWVVKALVSRGHLVRVLHRKSSDLSLLNGISFESTLGDVTDLESVVKAADGMDVIFHLAAVIAYDPKEYEKMNRVNIQGTENVAEACLMKKVKRLVHTSSVVAVGATEKPILLNEASPYEMDRYGFGYYDSKYRAEQVIIKAFKEKNLNVVIVNPAIMFGPGDATKSSRHMHMKVAQGKIPIFPPGGVNVLDVEDAVEGHLLAYEKGRAGERYILGGDNISIRDMFAWLAQIGGHQPPKIEMPAAVLRLPQHIRQFGKTLGMDWRLTSDSIFLSTMYHWYDLSKSKTELGYRPRPAKEAIRKSIEWAAAHGYLKTQSQ